MFGFSLVFVLSYYDSLSSVPFPFPPGVHGATPYDITSLGHIHDSVAFAANLEGTGLASYVISYLSNGAFVALIRMTAPQSKWVLTATGEPNAATGAYGAGWITSSSPQEGTIAKAIQLVCMVQFV